MRSLCTLSLLLCVGMLCGQSQWSFGLTISGGASGDRFEHRADYDSQAAFSSYSMMERKIQPSFGGGFWVARTWLGQFETSLGLEYRQTNSLERSESGSFDDLKRMTYYGENSEVVRLEQIQAPLEVRYFMGKNPALRPFVGFGVAPSYVIGGWAQRRNFSGYNNFEDYETVSELSFERGQSTAVDGRFNMPLLASMGLEVGRFRVSLRHSWSKAFNFQASDGAYYYPESPYTCICYPSYHYNMKASRAYTSLNVQYAL